MYNDIKFDEYVTTMLFLVFSISGIVFIFIGSIGVANSEKLIIPVISLCIGFIFLITGICIMAYKIGNENFIFYNPKKSNKEII